jgi:hypothetical protein
MGQGPKVGGHLAANFSIHNSFGIFMLKHNSKVGGQPVATAEPPKTGGPSNLIIIVVNGQAIARVKLHRKMTWQPKTK